MSDILTRWNSAKADFAKSAGIKDNVKAVVGAGTRAFGKIQPTEGRMAGFKSGLGAAKNKAGEMLGGKQKLDGSHKVLEPALGKLKGMAGKALDSPGVNLAAGLGGGSLIGNKVGEAEGLEAGKAQGLQTGKTEGLQAGASQGFDAGLQAGASQIPGDPGLIGRLMEVFTGRQGGAAPDDAQAAAMRQAAIQKILAGSRPTQ